MGKLIRAAEPFRFYTRLHLTELTGLRAAGLVQLEGTQLMAGFTAISPTVDMEGFGVIGSDPFASTVSATWFPPHIYYTRQVNENHWFGVGLFTRFGLGTEFDQGWFGRYNNTNAEITSVSVNPSWAWKLSSFTSPSQRRYTSIPASPPRRWWWTSRCFRPAASRPSPKSPAG